MTTHEQLQEQIEVLLRELREIGEFRKGTVNEVYRACGRPQCVCAQEGHPGHGPQFTLTFSRNGKTKTRVLSGGAAVKLVKEQTQNRERFTEWSRQWKDVNEQMSDLRLEELLSSIETPPASQEKKRRRRSSRKLHGKSSGS
jgi:hypothetical protein